jgi:hypothetical protein
MIQCSPYYHIILILYDCMWVTEPPLPKFLPSVRNLELSTINVQLDLPGSTVRIFELLMPTVIQVAKPTSKAVPRGSK